MKDILIIILIILVVSLFYFIFTGSFCHCSDVKCPNQNSRRVYG